MNQEIDLTQVAAAHSGSIDAQALGGRRPGVQAPPRLRVDMTGAGVSRWRGGGLGRGARRGGPPPPGREGRCVATERRRAGAGQGRRAARARGEEPSRAERICSGRSKERRMTGMPFFLAVGRTTEEVDSLRSFQVVVDIVKFKLFLKNL